MIHRHHSLARREATPAATQRNMPTRTKRTVLKIAGMHGNKCRENIAASLDSVPGVEDVEVNLYRAEAVITHAPPCDPDSLIRAVTACGYAADSVGTSVGDSNKRRTSLGLQ